jgi:hypothetical protein
MICESCGYHGICLVCSDEEEEEWSEEFDQDEMSAEVEAENGYGEEE